MDYNYINDVFNESLDWIPTKSGEYTIKVDVMEIDGYYQYEEKIYLLKK